MNNNDIFNIALTQSAKDYSINKNDLKGDGYSIYKAVPFTKEARNYLKGTPYLNLVHYGESVVAIVDDEFKEFIGKFLEINKKEVYRVFDAPQITVLNNELEKRGKCIAHLAQFYLPDSEFTPKLNNDLECKLLVGQEVSELYDDKRFSMALAYDCESSRRDVIALAGYLNGCLVGVAGASNDSDTMLQIGIDVLDGFRRQGIASTLTYKLSQEILNRGKVPFYCCAWSNIASKNTARKSGFKDAWVELTAKDVTVDWIKNIREIK